MTAVRRSYQVRLVRLSLALLMFWSVASSLGFLNAQEKQDDKKEAVDKDKKKALPLETDRTIAFDTTEGSWISLDVAPDGRQIVFELLGDLYTLPMEGGTATRIIPGITFDSQPRYSPDGARIVFL
ncbi:MAG: hypothetical protein H0W18_12500, partial [Acidobacteria bacterium]|nr:hypothetical protein [Acidobacteriota bacterium]